VTPFAVLTERAAVHVLVAGRARLQQSEKPSALRWHFGLRGLVTPHTREACVRANEREGHVPVVVGAHVLDAGARERMRRDQRHLIPMVIRMASLAARELVRRQAAVQPRSPFGLCRNDRMAVRAGFRIEALPTPVTGRARSTLIELGHLPVRGMQRPRSRPIAADVAPREHEHDRERDHGQQPARDLHRAPPSVNTAKSIEP
jgi:hypothetical protein